MYRSDVIKHFPTLRLVRKAKSALSHTQSSGKSKVVIRHRHVILIRHSGCLRHDLPQCLILSVMTYFSSHNKQGFVIVFITSYTDITTGGAGEGMHCREGGARAPTLAIEQVQIRFQYASRAKKRFQHSLNGKTFSACL